MVSSMYVVVSEQQTFSNQGLQYAPSLFAQAGLPGKTASFLASGLSAILMFAISIPAFIFADKWGRRTSAITGGLGLAGCMLLIGTLYASNAVHPYGIGRWIIIILVFIFSLTYCATWAIVGKIYASEIQPANTRAAASCVAQGLGFVNLSSISVYSDPTNPNQYTNWLVGMITPVLLSKSAYGAYFLFGGLALATVAVLAAYMPETRGMSLESIQDAFQQPPMLNVFASHLREFTRRFSPRGQSTSSDGSLELSRLDSEGVRGSTSIETGNRIGRVGEVPT
jgi:MFS family permease